MISRDREINGHNKIYIDDREEILLLPKKRNDN